MFALVKASVPTNLAPSARLGRAGCALGLSLAAVTLVAAGARAQVPAQEWAKDWTRFAEIATVHLQTTLAKDPVVNVRRGVAIAIPGAAGQPVEWSGIYSGVSKRDELVGIEGNGKFEWKTATWHVVKIKFYPAIRVRLTECEVVGDAVNISISDSDLSRWQRLREGVAVRVGFELGLRKYLAGNAPSPLTATVRLDPNGGCHLLVMAMDAKLLEAW